MKKFLLSFVVATLIFAGCSKINDRLDALEGRVDTIEKTQIATINQQITSINNSILLLNSTDKELGGYITTLEAKAEELEAKLTETNSKIDNVKNELSEKISTEKAAILAELESFKTAVNSELITIKSVLETLKAKDSDLEKQISDLKSYVDTELTATEDWATATFATLEQYNTVVTTIATLEGTIEGLNESIVALETRINEKIAKDIETASATLSADLQDAIKEITAAYTSAIATAKSEITEAYTTALQSAIATSEASMKGWIDEQLACYYTIAEIDAKIEVIKKALAEVDGTIFKEDIEALSEQIAITKAEITEAYKTAIAEAITNNNGVIDEKIAAEIAIVNERITVLENRLNTLEERISAVEDAIEQIKALDITFDNADNLACKAGASVELSYTITGGDSQTTIEAWGDGGWSADVIAESTTAGKVKVTAPNEISKRGKVVVLATSGAGGVAMKTLYFDKGILTDILDTYEVDWEACTLKVTLKTNLNYVVSIPTEAQSWIAVADTRATLRTETLTFTIAENPEDMPVRSATINLISECGDVLQSFEIIQNYQPSSAPIEFADANVKKVCVEKFDLNGDGELSYSEAAKVTSLSSSFFGDYASVVTSFNELVYFISLEDISYSFYNCTSLASIILPESITRMGHYAFFGCSNLTDVTIPDSVTTVGTHVFYNCSSLTHLDLPENIEIIGAYMFGGCSKLKSLIIPYSVTSIERSAFYCCSSLENIIIPDSVISIGICAFQQCRSLAYIDLPKNITTISSSMFELCNNLTTINLPNEVAIIDDEAFYLCENLKTITISPKTTTISTNALEGCFNLTNVYCKPTTPPSGYKGMFSRNASDRKIYVPIGSGEAYKTAEYWSDYADSIEEKEF